MSSIDFVINNDNGDNDDNNRFFMKLFNTNNIEIVKCCQQEFCFSLPSITLARRTENFSGKIDSVRPKDSCTCKLLYFVVLLAVYFIFSRVYLCIGLHVRSDCCVP